MMLSLCSADRAGKLSGTFISDREATLDYLRSTGAYSEEQIAKIGSVLGKMKVTFTGDTVMTELDGSRTAEEFSVVEEGPDHIVILTNLSGEKRVSNRIEFTSDGYWLITPGDRPFREKFRRLS
ncbi:MAG TPA: hypothetical protein VEP69_06280 [Thermodesulfovibrionales bacterium]|nr:hypothetical protein [Thermodesulfovibrionales bacterium]